MAVKYSSDLNMDAPCKVCNKSLGKTHTKNVEDLWCNLYSGGDPHEFQYKIDPNVKVDNSVKSIPKVAVGQTNCAVCSQPCKDWNCGSSCKHYINVCKNCCTAVRQEENPNYKKLENEDVNGNGLPDYAYTEYIEKAKKKLLAYNTATCYCCGAPCYDWKNNSGSNNPSYTSVCSSCSAEIHNDYYKEVGCDEKSFGIISSHKSSGNFVFLNGIFGKSLEVIRNKKMSSAPVSNRSELAREVISCLKDHMYPYGGYVRDQIAGKEFNDLDLFLPHFHQDYKTNNTYHTISSMVQKLRDDGFSILVIKNGEGGYSANQNHIFSKKIKISKNNISIEADLVESHAWTAEKDNPYPVLDVDINSLAIDKNGEYWAVTGLNKDTIIDNIQKGIFEAYADTPIERINKLKNKGFTELKKLQPGEQLTSSKLKVGLPIKCTRSLASTQVGRVGKILSIDSMNFKIQWDDGIIKDTLWSITYANHFIYDPPKEKNKKKVKEEMAKSKLKPIESLDLIEGDRCVLRIEDDGDEREVDATFLMLDENDEPIFALDKVYDSDTYSSGYWTDVEHPDRIARIADRYSGIDRKHNVIWTVDGTETTILKLIKHQKPKQTNKENNMAIIDGEEMSFTQVLYKDASKATIRTGATVGINGLKAGLRKIVEHEGMVGPQADAVMKFFDSKIGAMVLRASLGHAILHLPIEAIQENEYAQKLSEELRVSGLAEGMEYGMDLASKFLFPALMEAFKDTPLLASIMGEEPAKARVAETAPPARIAAPPVEQADELEIEADPFKAPGKQAAL